MTTCQCVTINVSLMADCLLALIVISL